METANEVMLVVNIVFMILNIIWLAFQANQQPVNMVEPELENPPTPEFVLQKASFDFSKVDAIGIERLPPWDDNNNLESTMITYYDIKGEYNEYSVYCDTQNHNRLVQEFIKQRYIKTGEAANV